VKGLGLTQPRWTLPLGLTALAVGVTSLPRFAESEMPSFAAAVLLLAAAGAWYGTFESRWSPEVLPKLRVGGLAAAVLLLSMLYDLLVTAIGLPAAVSSFLIGLQLSAAAGSVLVLLATAVDLALLGRFRMVRWFAVILAAGFAFSVAVRTFSSHAEDPAGAMAFVGSAGAPGMLAAGMVLLAFVVPLEWLVRLEIRQRVASLIGLVAAMAPLLAVVWIDEFTRLPHQHLLVNFASVGGLLVFAFALVLLLRAILSLPGASAYERKLREIDAVYDFGLAAGTAFDKEQLQSAVLDAMLKVVEPDIALMVQPQERGPGMQCVLLRAQSDAEHIYRYGARTPWDGLRERFADRRPVVIEDHRKAVPKRLEKVWEPSAGSSVVVPVITQDEVLRAVLIAGRFETHAFDASEVRSLRGFANQVALALDHARLLRETVESARRKRELEIARELQLKLLPTGPPTVPGLDIAGYSDPATEVGGDYYDYLTLRNGHPAIVVGEMSADNQFMTLVFVELDLAGGRLVYSNAGHHYPLHYRASSGAIEELESTGLPLGMLPQPPGPFLERALDPGDVLVLYSDGVVEAVDAADEMFGTARLGEVILAQLGRPAETVIEAIFAAVRAHTNGAPLDDDATAVVVRVLPEDEKTEASDADAAEPD